MRGWKCAQEVAFTLQTFIITKLQFKLNIIPSIPILSSQHRYELLQMLCCNESVFVQIAEVQKTVPIKFALEHGSAMGFDELPANVGDAFVKHEFVGRDVTVPEFHRLLFAVVDVSELVDQPLAVILRPFRLRFVVGVVFKFVRMRRWQLGGRFVNDVRRLDRALNCVRIEFIHFVDFPIAARPMEEEIAFIPILD